MTATLSEPTTTAVLPDVGAGSSTRAALPGETAIDRSLQVPVLLFFGSAITWLLVSLALSLVASIKMHEPSFLSGHAFDTYGRVRPAATDALLYGWLSSAGIGVGLWLTARLSRARLIHGGLLTAAWGLWNLGITLGTFGILNGESTSFEWLEYPRYVSILLTIAYAFIAAWALLMFHARPRGESVFISQWYVLAAFLWFPWVYATANLFMLFLPVQASAGIPVNWWFVHNLSGLWFTPLALAAAYYLVPKIVGRPIHAYGLAFIAFWALVFTTSWRGGQSLIGGPVPAWMVSVGIGAAILSVVPLLIVGNNLLGTLRERPDAVGWSPSLRFIYVSILSFLGGGGLNILLATRTVSHSLHFTLVEVAGSELTLYGFVSMAFFGAIYYITPRLTGWDWASSNLIRAHFWLTLSGLGLSLAVLAMAGVLQGYGQIDPKMPVTSTVQMIIPFLVTRSVGIAILLVGTLPLAASFGLNLLRAGGRALVTAAPVVDLPAVR